jgi:predicted DNA-binding protein
MTLTVRLESELDRRLRERCQAEGKTKSEIVSTALRRYLDEARPSAYDLGESLFGRYGSRDGEAADHRKSVFRDAAAAKHRRRR